MRHLLVILVLAGLGGSGCSDYFLEGKLCAADGGCLAGYVCQPESNRCVRPAGEDAGSPDGDDEPADGDGEPACPEAPQGQLVLTDVSLNGGAAQLRAETGSRVDVVVDYSISQVNDCPQCLNLFLFGLAGPGYGNEPQHCHRAGIPPPCPAVLQGQATFDFTVPQTPGRYEIRAAVAQADDCAAAMNDYTDWMSRRAAQAAVIEAVAPACSPWLYYLNDVQLDSGGPSIAVDPDQEVDFSSDYVATGIDSCPQCRAMLVIGIDGQPQFCHDAGTLPLCPSVDQGRLQGRLTAPHQPGTYTVRVLMVANTDCSSAQAAYQSAPPDRSRTVATVTVE